jgi:hypothetical protein
VPTFLVREPNIDDQAPSLHAIVTDPNTLAWIPILDARHPKSAMRLSHVVSLVLMGTVQAAVSTISAYGNKFFYENGTRNVPSDSFTRNIDRLTMSKQSSFSRVLPTS